jgi:response regulator RpfG family c-di-GMP phosphodiesterase
MDYSGVKYARDIEEVNKVPGEEDLEKRKKIIEGWNQNGELPIGGRKKTILVIDDMSEILQAVKAVLEDQYEVRVARSGDLAQSIVHNISVDLILLDIEMPGESGFEYFERLKADPLTQNIPVMFLSSHAEPEVVSYAARLDIKGYIKKPVEPQTLKQRVYDVFSKKDFFKKN